LEDRCLPATVTTLQDGVAGSLRDAIASTPAGGTVTFQAGLIGTITLGSVLSISKNLTISGPGADTITVSGNNATEVLNVAAGSTVAISGLTVASGQAVNGGGILNNGTLTLTADAVSQNTATGGGRLGGQGGGILNLGTLTLVDCAVFNNTANASPIRIVITPETVGQGAGIANGGSGSLTLTNCTVANNTAFATPGGTGSGPIALAGGILEGTVGGAAGGPLTLTNCTVAGNTGGGLDIVGSSVATLTNTLVATNTASPGGTVPDISGHVSAADHDFVGNGTGSSGIVSGTNGNQVGTGAKPLDPHLGSLQNNGGPTPTMALLPGSTAIGAGNTAAVANPPFPGPPFTDQRGAGFARIVNQTVDIGAYEVQALLGNPPAQVEFDDGSFIANETDGTVAITLVRTGNSSAAASVLISTVTGGSAVAGTDYIAGSLTVTWAAGDASPKVLFFRLLDDAGSGEGNQTVNLALSQPAGATLGSQSTAVVTSVEDSDVGSSPSPPGPGPGPGPGPALLVVTNSVTPRVVTLHLRHGHGRAIQVPELLYLTTVTNLGPNEATGVRLVDLLSRDVVFGAALSSPGIRFRRGRKVVLLVGILPPGTRAAMLIATTPIHRGRVGNSAFVTAATPDLNPVTRAIVALRVSRRLFFG
jgi:hypothetical protein